MTSFRNLYRKLVPGWLQRDDGEKVLFSLGAMLDAFADRTRQSLEARFPSRGPDDALAPMARDRLITRGINEPRATFENRLVSWLDTHRTRGGPWTLLRQLRAYMGTPVEVRTVDDRGNWFSIDAQGNETYLLDQGNWDWDGLGNGGAYWSRFWVIIYASGSPWPVRPTWAGGGNWGDEGRTWGSSATPEEVAGLRSIVAGWKPDGTQCERIILCFDADDQFSPLSTLHGPGMPDGTWDKATKNVGGVQVANRLSTAIYINGSI